MIGETPGRSGQQFCRDKDEVSGGRNVNSISSQTGEEFSTEFLRDRIAQRREWDQNQTRDMGFSFYQNHPGVREDPATVHRLRRIESECDTFDFVPVTEYMSKAENRGYHDNTNRCHWECLPDGQKSRTYDDEFNSDPVILGPNTPPKYVMESPQSYNPFETRDSQSNFSGKVKFLCSFGGRILPRPNDGKLRYVGGETRIISIRKNLTLEELVKKTAALCNHTQSIKYQLPGEDLDALISVCSDEDLHHMIEEYQELERNGGSQRLRLFLVSSGEPDSPNSFEGRTPHQSDADYQYVFAVNCMLDNSPRKSSSGQSLASQTTQFGTASDSGQNVHRDSPMSAHALHNKDTSPNHPNLIGTNPNPSVQFLSTFKVQGKSFTQSPPVSPITIQNRENDKPKVQFFIDQACTDGNESHSTFALDKSPYNNAHQQNASAYNTDISDGALTLMNYHHGQTNSMETDNINKGFDMNFHNRSPSGDFLLYQVHAQGDLNLERTSIKGRALSDSNLQEHDEAIKYCLEEAVIPASLWANRGEKSPSLAMSNGSQERKMLWQDIVEENYQLAKSENQCSFKAMAKIDLDEEVLNWMNRRITCSDDDRKQYRGNIEASSNDKSMEYKNLASFDYLSDNPYFPQDYQESIPVGNLESSEKNQDHQLHTDAPDLFVKNQIVKKDQDIYMIERLSQPVSQGLPAYQYCPPQDRGNLLLIPNSTSVINATSSKVVSPYNEELVNYPGHIVEKVGKQEQSNNAPHQLHPLNKHQENKVLESVVIIEDVTGSTPPDTSFTSRVIPLLEEDVADEFESNRNDDDDDDESISQDSESEESEGEVRDVNDSISDAAMAEIEAGIYGLQIIKNTDIEELRELGSGTFGTVYYGKWRGTDVAIKRIKNSCFTGKSSEQEKLTKDFWREAQILSNLHHPNVVAFYGVVPDGPGGTMATVTEFMVNGSLRHALQKKDRALDHRKKLMIALDAAFGMEYLHLKHIVHFDLKCDNLLVNLRDSQRPICKVGDFGLSRIKRNTLVSGGVRGTLPWIAPELLDGNSNQVSEKIDVYSFGISMWEILTGEEPYANMHCGAIIGGIVSNMLRPPVPENCDPEWRKLMEECWSFDPAARPSFTEITNRLRAMSAALQPKRRNFANR